MRQTISDVYHEEVTRAINHAERDHGRLTSDHVRSLAILTEEVGEAAKEILQSTRRGSRLDDSDRGLIPTWKEHKRGAIRELAQVAAVAILMIENIEAELEGQ